MTSYLNTQIDLSNGLNLIDEVPFWSAPFGFKLLEEIPYLPKMTVLDIGSGTGFPMTEIALRLGEGSKVYGLEPNHDALERARRKIAFFGISNAQMIEGFAESIPLEDNSIDLITSNNGINNVKDKTLALQECSRVCRPGGLLIQTMNSAGSMKVFYDTLIQKLKDSGLQEWTEKVHEHIEEKRPSTDHMSRLLASSGFAINTIEPENFNYRFATGTAFLNHYFIRLAFMDSWKKLIPPDRTVEIFSLVEESLNQIALTNKGLTIQIPFVLIKASKIKEA